MIRLIILTVVFLLLSGCAIDYLLDYPAQEYRCYEVDVKSGITIPPMPDCRENNKTLVGIDSDNDGVRDDLQRYIAGLDIDHPYFKRGLTQYARALQKTMQEYDREELAQRNFFLQNLALDCALSANLSPPNSTSDVYHLSDELRDLHLNTFKRRSAHSIWRSHLETQLVPRVKPKVACNFDTAKFVGERMR